MNLKDFLRATEDLKSKKVYITVFDNRKEFMSPLNDEGREMFKKTLSKVKPDTPFVEVETYSKTDYYLMNELGEAYKSLKERGLIAD